MLDPCRNRFGLAPNHIAGDVAYGTAKLLDGLVGRAIEPHIPVWDRSRRDGAILSRNDFTFESEDNVYVCPQGKTLKTNNRVHAGKTLYYRAVKADCDACPLKYKCCPKAPSRRIPRDVNEAARDHARALMGSEGYSQSARDRKKIERLFGEAKRNLAMNRLRLRGLAGAKDEFLMLAAVQNLKRLAKLAAIPPPRHRPA